MGFGDGGDCSGGPPQPFVLACCCDWGPLGSFFSGLGAGFPLVLLLGLANAVAMSASVRLTLNFSFAEESLQ